MNYPRAMLVRTLVGFFGPDDRRIEHALRVLFHAERLAPDFPGCDPEIVCNIVGNHHSASRYDYPELALLKEADRIVNSGEDLGSRADGPPPVSPGRSG